MKQIYLLIFLFGFYPSIFSQATLSYNTCEVIKTTNHSCNYSWVYWAREFELSDFNITPDQEFTITQGDFALTYTSSPTYFNFNIYAIDDNFPDSFDNAVFLGSSQRLLAPLIGNWLPTQFFTIIFDSPVVIPAGTKRILVELKKNEGQWGSGLAHIAGTEIDQGISWLKDCTTGGEYKDADSNNFYQEINNYYITVAGTKRSITTPFTLNITNNCSDFFKGFNLTNKNDVASVLWDFGDPASGSDNTSGALSPKHDFSVDGTFTVKATIVHKSGAVYTIQETIDVRDPPEAYLLPDLKSCEKNYGSGIADFDLSTLEQQILKGRTNIEITYLNGYGNKLTNLLNVPYANSIQGRETISVRVAYKDEPCCYSETTFDLIVNSLPDISKAQDLIGCDDNHDGYALFDLNQLQSEVESASPHLVTAFYHENGTQIDVSGLGATSNKVINEETIQFIVKNNITGCEKTGSFRLIVLPQPIAHNLPDLYGCDDNGDGISEYFDTSSIFPTVLESQSGMVVTYFDSSGNQLASPLPNPFTNSIANKEIIIVRVTNPSSGCYDETVLTLKTSLNPSVSRPGPFYACDNGNGYSSFDTSDWITSVIGSQNGIEVSFFDSLGDPLPNPLPAYYQNTTAWNQTLKIRVENQMNPSCFTETDLELQVEQLPQLNMQTAYVICNNEPNLLLNAPAGFDTYLWEFNDRIVSTSGEVLLEEDGNYILTVEKLENGIFCSVSETISLSRSAPPVIKNVEFDQLGNNYIRINASKDGDFEYSINGIVFQNENYFSGISGGKYTVYIRDKEGCGMDSKELFLLDYPRFFTPNGDGHHDYWQLKGIENYTEAVIRIYDRFGKLLKQIRATEPGWDGTFNGFSLPSGNYWFSASFKDGTNFNGHFALKR